MIIYLLVCRIQQRLPRPAVTVHVRRCVQPLPGDMFCCVASFQPSEAVHGCGERHELAVAREFAFQFAAYLPSVGDVEHDATAEVYAKPAFFVAAYLGVLVGETYQRIYLKHFVVVYIPVEVGIDVPVFQTIFLEVAVEAAHYVEAWIDVIQHAAAQKGLSVQYFCSVAQVEADAPLAVLCP